MGKLNWIHFSLIFLFALFLGLSSSSSLSECPEKWHRFESKCYFVNTTAVHSKYNKVLCESLNATMVSVHSPTENEYLRRLVFIHYDSHKWAWLSRARNYNRSHGYMWSDKSTFDFDNWVQKEPECDICCEISLMQSGHWFGSNCNSWTFVQLCQRILEGPVAYDQDSSFYLNQLEGRGEAAPVGQLEPNVTEMLQWLAYEVEEVKENLNQMNSTVSDKDMVETLQSRESYLLTLLSLTVTLLLLIMVSVILSYYLIVRKLRLMATFADK